MMRTVIRLIPVCLVLAVCAGCGAKADFARAERLEKKGYLVEAGFAFDEIDKKYPRDPRAAEALYRAGRIYQRLKLYPQAVRYFKKIVERHSSEKDWVERAQLGLLNSPDFFPIVPGSFWIEGDSETGGRNMRAEWNCVKGSSGTVVIERRISAGSQLVAQTKRYYRKAGAEVREYAFASSYDATILFSWPFAEDKSWTTKRDNRTVVYKVVERNLPIKVKAGEFAGCMKISETDPLLPRSVKFNYYAPDVGWVLTTTAALGGAEHHNTELLSYKILPEE